MNGGSAIVFCRPCPDCRASLRDAECRRGGFADVGSGLCRRRLCTGCGEEWIEDDEGRLFRYRQPFRIAGRG